jgi:hypothetical protein
MAVTNPVQGQIVAQREQTWRINFELPAGGEPSVQIYREVVGLDADGNSVGQPVQSYTAVNRTFAAVANEIATLQGGYEISFGDIVEALSIFGDGWAAEDAAAPPPGGPMSRSAK